MDQQTLRKILVAGAAVAALSVVAANRPKDAEPQRNDMEKKPVLPKVTPSLQS
jgi:hypothetical protein